MTDSTDGKTVAAPGVTTGVEDKAVLTQETIEAIQKSLLDDGYVYMGGKVSAEGDVRGTFVRNDGSGEKIFVNIDRTPTELEIGQGTFAAIEYGLIHCFSRVAPVKYSQIDAEDMSPANKEFLKAHSGLYQLCFWGPRVLIIGGYLIWSGNLGTLFSMVGTMFGIPLPAPVVIPTVVPTTIATTIATTVPTTIATSIPTTVLTTVPTTVATVVPTTELTTVVTTAIANVTANVTPVI